MKIHSTAFVRATGRSRRRLWLPSLVGDIGTQACGVLIVSSSKISSESRWGVDLAHDL